MNALLMATAMAISPPPPAMTHEVHPGESLSWIAQCELGDANRWTELVELNQDRIDDPNLIVAGWQIALPEAGTGECLTRPPAPSVSAATSSEPAPGRTRSASSEPSSPAGGSLVGIRQCESGGDYGAVSSNGKYRGAYQFDQQTWESVGGSGDPAAASSEEQDRRARALRQQRGSSPWPSCG